MALQNENGEYAKVIEVNPYRNMVTVEIFKDASTRANPTKFDQTHFEKLITKNLPEVIENLSLTSNLLNDLATAGYEAIKVLPPFNDGTWIDV